MLKKIFRPGSHEYGFTLVEMIGVLAIIAIDCLITPKNFLTDCVHQGAVFGCCRQNV